MLKAATVNLLIKQEKQLFLRKGSLSVLGNLIDDEFMEIGSRAQIHDKAEVLRWLASDEPTDIDGLHFKAKGLAENLILLNYLSITKTDQTAAPKQAFRSSIWKYSDKQWRMIFHQATPIF